MSLSSWRQRIIMSRQHPAMFLGTETDNLIFNSIRAPSNLVYKTKLFTQPAESCLSLTPEQYCWTFQCGVLRREVERVVAWDTCDVLFDALSDSRAAIQNMRGRWAAPFQTNTHPLAIATANLLFAEVGIFAIRSSKGLWWQAYKSGWPVMPPTLDTEVSQDVGLVIAASLSSEWFPELPFTAEGVEAVIPADVLPYVKIDWQESDIIHLPNHFTELRNVFLTSNACSSLMA